MLSQFVVVSYDISNDRRRTKVMKTLEGYGAHVQYSVFECRLKPVEIAEMRKQLKKLVGKADSARLYFIGAEDVKRIEVIGSGEVTSERMVFLH
ncbi:MAG: CRISPR-associated endonuclease Cas2 [Anaerolineales bacterium]|nr:CRISPR-associated endonuclease Cas2 [Anaerolineales bacterium]